MGHRKQIKEVEVIVRTCDLCDNDIAAECNTSICQICGRDMCETCCRKGAYLDESEYVGASEGWYCSSCWTLGDGTLNRIEQLETEFYAACERQVEEWKALAEEKIK